MKPYYQDEAVTIYHGECAQIAPFLGRFDLLLTDPPYGLGSKLKAGPNGEWSKGFENAPKWDEKTCDDWLIHMLIKQCKQSIIWGGNYYDLPKARCWLGWDKMQEHTSGHYELAWTNLDLPTRMFRKSRIAAYGRMDKKHPTQKPLDLIRWCINLAKNAETIFDPFAGSGTTGRACKDLGKKCVLIEREESYCEIAAHKMTEIAPMLIAE